MQESIDHAALVQLFRDDPQLAASLLTRQFGVAVPSLPARVLDPVLKPGTLIPDLVIALGDPLDPAHPTLIIVVEVQRSIDPDKRFSWPAYLWLERLRWRCEVILLVVAPDARVAQWAETAIHCGAGNQTQPLVLGPGRIPWIRDRAQAHAQPGLAVLSARAHGGEPGGLEVVRAALEGLYGFDNQTLRMYIDLALSRLSDPVWRRVQEETMILNLIPPSKYPTPLADEFLAALEDRASRYGMALANRRALLAVLAARDLTLTPAQRARLDACSDPDQYERWFDRSLTAASIEEVLGE